MVTGNEKIQSICEIWFLVKEDDIFEVWSLYFVQGMKLFPMAEYFPLFCVCLHCVLVMPFHDLMNGEWMLYAYLCMPNRMSMWINIERLYFWKTSEWKVWFFIKTNRTYWTYCLENLKNSSQIEYLDFNAHLRSLKSSFTISDTLVQMSLGLVVQTNQSNFPNNLRSVWINSLIKLLGSYLYLVWIQKLNSYLCSQHLLSL